MTDRTGTALILNVDDDDAARYATSRQLKKAGFDTIDAATGSDGLRLAVACRPDLVLLDIRLPDIDGYEVCRRLRANAEVADIPVLQMSASYVDISSHVRGLENGADGYLTEPVEPPILVATINSLLRMKRAEQRVGLAARQWKATFEAVQDGFAFLDLSGHVLQSNSAYAAICRPEPARVAAIARELLGRLLETGARVTAEETVGERTFSITVDSVFDDASNFTGAVCTMSDITAKKKFESELRQTQKLESIGILAGGIAHDFNNLLTGIIGNGSLLVEMLPAADPTHDIALEIMKAGDSAAQLTSQILAYAGKGKMTEQPVNLADAILENIPLIRRFVPKNVELVCEADRTLPAVSADPKQIQQAIMNLIINAAESFDGQGGSITVRTSSQRLEKDFFQPGDGGAEPGDYVLLSIADNGSGMDEETQSRIFEPFFTTKFMGRGLGLSAVHGIMGGHKGVLRLQSAPGMGTTFRLYLRAAPVKAEPAPMLGKKSETRKTRPRRSGTVLVIDDESTVRNFARLALENLGYRVLTAEDGKSGVEVFRALHSQISLVLLDFTMPVMNGEQALTQIRLISSSVPVILSSGFTEAVAAERFKGLQLAGFLAKPYTLAQLFAAIDRVLERDENSVAGALGRH